MGKKKTVFTWILLVLMTLWIITNLDSVISNTLGLANFSGWGFFNLITSMILLTLIITAWIKMFNVRPDVQKWINYMFGFGILLGIISIIYLILAVGISGLKGLESTIFILLLQISMWKGISMHLKRAKKENLMDFS